ncbi:hypothetical protein B296_00037389 [Ensete ventricosum]|uniref:Uncharacterized protein n=1 Tax=Ensete ventricosum TaxID=4639 RepID=A0A426ZZM6_ENSVE|nr:hypothetical protein B296_00037389 [Ensete ventricosum]
MRVMSSLQCLTSHRPPVVRGTVRWSVAASALPRRLSPTVRGQGVMFVGWPVAFALPRRQLPAAMGQGHWSRVGLARRLCCATCCQRGQLAETSKGSSEVRNPFRYLFMGHTCKGLYQGLDCGKKDCHEALDLLGHVARKLVGLDATDSWQLMATKVHQWDKLMVTEGCVSGATGLKVVEGWSAGTIGLTVIERCVSSMIGLTVAERCILGTIRLMTAGRCALGTIGLMMA